MEIKVDHTSEIYRLFKNRTLVIRKGCLQNVDFTETSAKYMIPSASSLLVWHFRNCARIIVKISQSLAKTFANARFAFCASLDVSLPSYFSVVVRYCFPGQDRFHWISLTLNVHNRFTVECDLDLPEVNPHFIHYITILMNMSGTDMFGTDMARLMENLSKRILLMIAAQFLYFSVLEDVNQMGKPEKSFLLFSVDSKLMQLWCGDSMAFYIHLSLEGAKLRPANNASLQLWKKCDWDMEVMCRITGNETQFVTKEYRETSRFICNLVFG